MISLKNFERLQELQQQIVWQSVLELEPRTLVPEASSRDILTLHLYLYNWRFQAVVQAVSHRTNFRAVSLVAVTSHLFAYLSRRR